MIWFIWTGALMSVLDLKSSNFLCSNSLHRKIGYNKVKLCWKFEKPLACESQCIKHVEMVLLETSVCLFIANSHFSQHNVYPEKLIHFFFYHGWIKGANYGRSLTPTSLGWIKKYRDKQYRWFFYIYIYRYSIYIYRYIYILHNIFYILCNIYSFNVFN